jgi:DNA repair protein RecN (Recombination protein N)
VLRELRVRNLAVVADAAVELGPGLNALTGETGAGKSLIVDSLALLAGGRASAEAIRSGAETLQVVGLFEPATGTWRGVLEAAGLEAEGLEGGSRDGEGAELLIRREVSRAGKNRVFLNDQPATVRLLGELGPELLRIHGQREELGLVEADLQRAWLDQSGGAEALPLTAAVAASYARWADLAGRLARVSGDERSRRERVELLTFQARELDAAGLSAGEEDALREERERLRHAETLRRGFGEAEAWLAEQEDAASAQLARARTALEGLGAWEPRVVGWVAELEEARIRTVEVAREVRERLTRIDGDPRRLDFLEDRLALVERLCRRFGGTTTDLVALRERIAAELEELAGEGAGREELEAAAAEALATYRTAALALSAARAAWGERLARALEAELVDLGLGKARMAVRLEPRRRAGAPLEVGGARVEPAADGLDEVVFELAANPGEPLAPLAKIASGGELARIYLALQLAVGLERAGQATTLVFDEVDAGLGGAQAAALGKKLQRLAARTQVLVVTHQPQVAACADRHFRIQKSEQGGRTFTQVERLEAAARIEETARMLAGSEITELARSHARELIAGSERRA